MSDRPSYAQLAWLFFRIGVLGFGGPAAHIAMMEDELIKRRRWISQQDFIDLVGATNLIPGPNSTEMAIHLGLRLRGWPGMLVAGACFIGPAVTLTGILAWFYVTYGDLPEVEPLLRGVKPAVIAIILAAVLRLGRKAVTNASLAVLAVIVVALSLAGMDEALLILAGGGAGMLWFAALKPALGGGLKSLPLILLAPLAQAAQQPPEAQASLREIALFFLKIGCILFGSGYVLFAFLEDDVVAQYGWMTTRELIDAVAVGQFTPGPVLSTSTFVGYLLHDIPGAIVATVSIFTPSFIFVLLLSRLVPRLRDNKWAASFLDSVNASALALMFAVATTLSIEVLVGWSTAVIAVFSLILIDRLDIHPGLVVLVGAALGWLLI